MIPIPICTPSAGSGGSTTLPEFLLIALAVTAIVLYFVQIFFATERLLSPCENEEYGSIWEYFYRLIPFLAPICVFVRALRSLGKK